MRTAPPGGMEYDPPHCTGTTVQGHACTARRSKGTNLCIGHLRSKEKHAAK